MAEAILSNGRLNGLPDDEYNNLKKEILQYQHFRLQIMTFTVAALAVVVGLPMQQKMPRPESVIDLLVQACIVYLPYLLLLPSCYLTYILSKSTMFIGTYLMIFHEGVNKQPGWEYAHFEMDRLYPSLRPSKSRNYAYFYLILGFFALIYSGLLAISRAIKLYLLIEPKSFLFGWTSRTWWIIGLSLIDLLLFVMLFWIVLYLMGPKRLQDYKTELFQHWMEFAPALNDARQAPFAWVRCRIENTAVCSTPASRKPDSLN
jgi:hypothetical protein